MDTIFTISGIFFLYNFLVRLSGKTRNGVHSVQSRSETYTSPLASLPVRRRVLSKGILSDRKKLEGIRRCWKDWEKDFSGSKFV
jgi:hypothetical protein